MSYTTYPEPVTGINANVIIELFACAAKGDIEAAYKLGMLFYTLSEADDFEDTLEDNDIKSYKATLNLMQARYWLELAANQDYTPAQYMLGVFCPRCSEGQESRMWLIKAAENGHARAQARRAYSLGLVARTARSTEKLNQAIELATKSAEQGDAFGMYVLSKIYGSKRFHVHDQAKADEWKKKALEAAKNDPTIKFSD